MQKNKKNPLFTAVFGKSSFQETQRGAEHCGALLHVISLYRNKQLHL